MTLGPEAIAVLNGAQWEAVRQGKAEADTGHLLLGLLHPPPSRAASVLAELGVQPKPGRLNISPLSADEVWPPAVPRPALTSRLARDSNHVLRLAQKEAEIRGDIAINPEHLVIGLLCEKRGLGAMLLYAHGLTVEKMRPLLFGLRSLE